jgi:TrkA domain protein
MARNPQSPIQIREATLPGIGKKYVMPLREGGNVAIIVKPDGERQVYHFEAEQDRPCDVVTMDPDEAQQVANLLGKPMLQVPDLEKLELALGGLEIEWVKLDDDSPLMGKTLGSTRLRTQTGASVIAIMRGGQAIANPSIDTAFAKGDTVLLIGSHEQCETARQIFGS